MIEQLRNVGIPQLAVTYKDLSTTVIDHLFNRYVLIMGGIRRPGHFVAPGWFEGMPDI